MSGRLGEVKTKIQQKSTREWGNNGIFPRNYNRPRITLKNPNKKQKAAVEKTSHVGKHGEKLLTPVQESTIKQMKIFEIEEINKGNGKIYDNGNIWENSPKPPFMNSNGRGILRGTYETTTGDVLSSQNVKKYRVVFSSEPHHVRFYHSPTLFTKTETNDGKKKVFKNQPNTLEMNTLKIK